MTEVHPTPGESFSVFNVQTNRKLYKELVGQIDRDKVYITELEKIIHSHGIEVPKEIMDALASAHKPHHLPTARIMEDGSLNALAESLNMIQDHNKMHEVNIQYRNLTFWSTVPKKSIPTVGSAIKKIFFGSGPKQRVNVIKDLTGRIMPKTMTLLMGPPGCGSYLYLYLLFHFCYVLAELKGKLHFICRQVYPA